MPRDTICARESRRWLAPPRRKEDKFFSAVLPKLPLGSLAYESRYRSLACSSTHTQIHRHTSIRPSSCLRTATKTNTRASPTYFLLFFISTKQAVLSITDLVQEKKNLAWMRGLPRGLRGSDGMSPHYSAKSPRLHSQLTCITCTIYFCAVKAWDTM